MNSIMDRLSNYNQLQILNPVQDPNNSLHLQYNSTFNDFIRPNKPTPIMSVKYSLMSIIYLKINKL